MDTSVINAMTDNFRRMATFHETPLPSTGITYHASLLKYNSPLKMSNAGFFREPDAVGDEVKCFRCSLVFRGWNGQSPISVHRILSPGCPFLQDLTPTHLTATTPATTTSINGNATDIVRRRLQFDSPTLSEDATDVADTNNVIPSPQVAQRSLLDVLSGIQTPRITTELPSLSDSDNNENSAFMLFEGQRLKTFPSSSHPRAEEWASAGFVYKQGGVVKCIFCGVEMAYNSEQPSKLHRAESRDCPIVRYLDVGNIPLELENSVRLKHSEQSGGDEGVRDDPVFRHPQFEEREQRLKTFLSWPKQMQHTPQQMCQAGFYYTGHTDKVMCFACGIGLYNWDSEADPWTQHARHSPQCVYVRLEKGDNFVSEAQDIKILTMCDRPTDSGSGSHDNAHLRTSLDMSAINAALACGYFPNEALLLGTLRAPDANFTLLQRQREQLHNKNLSLLLCTEQLQQQHQELERSQEEHQTDLEREQEVRYRERQLLQQQNTTLMNRLYGQGEVIQRRTHQLQDRDDQLQDRDDQLQDRDDQLENQNSEMERKQRELEAQTKENRRQAEENRRQAEENRRQAEKIEKLSQLLLANNIQEPDGLPDNPVPAVPAVASSSTYSRCKVCLEEDAQCLLRPCRHVCCGTQCAPHFIGGKCPICRGNVEDWELIFVA